MEMRSQPLPALCQWLSLRSAGHRPPAGALSQEKAAGGQGQPRHRPAGARRAGEQGREPPQPGSSWLLAVGNGCGWEIKRPGAESPNVDLCVCSAGGSDKRQPLCQIKASTQGQGGGTRSPLLSRVPACAIPSPGSPNKGCVWPPGDPGSG